MPVYKVNGVKKDGLQKYNVRVNYISDSGKPKQLTRTAYGLEAAKDLERRLTDEQKSKGEPPAKKMTVQQLFDEYIAAKKNDVKESSLEKCQQTIALYVLPMLKDVRIDRLNAKILQEWKQAMSERITNRQAKLSLNSKQHAFNDFRAMMGYAVRMEYISKNPLPIVGNFTDTSGIKKEMQYYTAHEFKQFIGAAKQIAQGRESKRGDLSEWDYYVFFNVAFYTGLRKGEIHALKWSDVNGSYLSVKRSIRQVRIGADRETAPKNKSSVRTLQMPLPLIEILNVHKERQAGCFDSFSDDYRVCGGEACLRDSTIDQKNTLYSETAGQKKIRLHDYRHSHVSILANEGINIQEIARRLGHAKIEMTWNTYSHLYPREEERAVDVLNSIA
jgi:integrase